MAGVVPGTGLTYLLAIDGVSGSVTDPSHPGALAVSNYSFPVSRPSDATGDASRAAATI